MTRLFAGTPFDRPPRCEVCEELEDNCTCPPPEPQQNLLAPEKQTARIAIEKRKRGKQVTIVRDLDPDGNDLPAILTRLKTVCGAGGTIKDGTIEIQGRHTDSVRTQLQTMGYKVKG